MSRALFVAAFLLFVLPGRAQLREGVYEYAGKLEPDSGDMVVKGDPVHISSYLHEINTYVRRLTVERSSVGHYLCYEVAKGYSMPSAVAGYRGSFMFETGRKRKSGFRTRTREGAVLTVDIPHPDTLHVELTGATVTRYYSGGTYFKRPEVLHQDKVTLVWQRELNAVDRERMKKTE